MESFFIAYILKEKEQLMIRKKRTNGMGKMIFNKQRKCYTGTLNCEEPSSGLIRTKSFSAPTRREVEKRMQEWKEWLRSGYSCRKAGR